MSRQINRLSVLKLKTLNTIGRHADGAGLYLSIAKDGGRKWVFLYRRAGRLREMGLGSARTVTLAQAREKAALIRSELAYGRDPLLDRATKVKSPSFRECFDQYITANSAGWRNAKHATQWQSTMETYVFPTIGRRPVAEITTDHVIHILTPIWSVKTETASRVRGRIETVLDWAAARRLRSGENPARWRGHLDMLLPKRSKVQKVEHHSALPFIHISSFLHDLHARSGAAALALEYAILTAARTSEVLLSRCSEFDLERRVWTVPAERMKAGREHRVPLSSAAMKIVSPLIANAVDPSDLVFARDGTQSRLSSNAMLALLARMNFSHVTVHGFRSTFRDWAAETTAVPSEIVEMSLAHTIKNKAEAAYRRGDLLQKRSELMEAWATYCETPR